MLFQANQLTKIIADVLLERSDNKIPAHIKYLFFFLESLIICTTKIIFAIKNANILAFFPRPSLKN